MDGQQPPDEPPARLSADDRSWLAEAANIPPENLELPPGYEQAVGAAPANAASPDAPSATDLPQTSDPQSDEQLQQAIASGQVVPLTWGRSAEPDAAVPQRSPMWRLRFRLFLSSRISSSGLPSRELLQQYRLRKFEKLQARLSALLNQDGISEEARAEIQTALNTLNEGSDSEEALTAARAFLIERVPLHEDASKIRKAVKLLARRAEAARNRRRFALQHEERARLARANRRDEPDDEIDLDLPQYGLVQETYRSKVLSDNIYTLQLALEKLRSATIPSVADIALHEEYIAILTARLNGRVPPPTTIEDNWEDIENAISQMSGMSEIGGNGEENRPPSYPQDDVPDDGAGPSVHHVRSAEEEARMFFKGLIDLSADDSGYMDTVARQMWAHLQRLRQEQNGILPEGYEEDFGRTVRARASEKIAASVVNKGKARGEDRNQGSGSGA